MKILIFSFLLIAQVVYSSNSYSFTGIKESETTRLMSQSGAGVGSVLLNEATILNPASIVFMKESSFYYQKGSEELDEKSDLRTTSYKDGKDEMIIITDTSSRLKGGLSYHYQNVQAGKRTRYTASLGSHFGKRSTFGIAFRHAEEQSAVADKTYNQFVIGLSHILNDQISLGTTIVDPAQTVDEYFKYTAGVHYTINEFIALILDIGAGDVKNFQDDSFNRWALQVNSFKRFFFRYGRFHDY